jgi:uncharacterized membrane protein
VADVFISYKKEQRDRVLPIAERLQELGVSVWFDVELSAGRSFTEEIQEELRNCKAQLVLWSPTSILSEWVRGEAEIGRQRNILVAVRIEPCDLLPPFNMHHVEDLFAWNGEVQNSGWLSIVRRVGNLIGRPGLHELQRVIATGDTVAWRALHLRFPNDTFVVEAAKRANVALEKIAPNTVNEPSATSASHPPSVQELRAALEAASFRLRVYEEAKKRYRWQNPEEEKRLTLEAESLRQALQDAALDRFNDHTEEAPKKRRAFPMLLSAMIVGSIAISVALLGSIQSPNPNAPRLLGGEGEVAAEPDQLQILIDSLGAPTPDQSSRGLFYGGTFEAVGLDPRWAVQIQRTGSLRAQYADAEPYDPARPLRQVRSQGFYLTFNDSMRSYVLIVKFAHCSLPNGVRTDHQAFLLVDGSLHEGCAKSGTSRWPLDEQGSEVWDLPPLVGVQEAHEEF